MPLKPRAAHDPAWLRALVWVQGTKGGLGWALECWEGRGSGGGRQPDRVLSAVNRWGQTPEEQGKKNLKHPQEPPPHSPHPHPPPPRYLSQPVSYIIFSPVMRRPNSRGPFLEKRMRDVAIKAGKPLLEAFLRATGGSTAVLSFHPQWLPSLLASFSPQLPLNKPGSHLLPSLLPFH